jgi:hypothetical protein
VTLAKAKKNYPKSMRLLIYLNIGEYGTMQKEIEGAMADSTAVAKEAFAEVWVLWKARLYLVWQGGIETNRVVELHDPL